MPIYTQDFVGTTRQALQDLEPSFGTKMDAAIQGAWLDSYGPKLVDTFKAFSDTGRDLTPDEVSLRVKDAGLEGKIRPGEYTEGALDTIIERQKELKQINDVRARTPWGAGSPIRGAAMLAAGIADPINVAAAFFPAAKLAQFLKLEKSAAYLAALESKAALGVGAAERTIARAQLGAIEGAVGSAVLEPVSYAASQYLNDDYTAADSLLNIAFGTAFGGGLHVVSGAVGDVISKQFNQPSIHETLVKLDPETRQAALQTAVGQLAAGRNVNVEQIISLDPVEAKTIAVNEVKQAFTKKQAADFEKSGEIPIEFKQAIDERISELSPRQIQTLDNMRNNAGEYLSVENDRLADLTQLEEIKLPDDELIAAEQELSDISQSTAELINNAGIGETMLPQVAELDTTFEAQIKAADEYGRAANAAALCLTRT